MPEPVRELASGGSAERGEEGSVQGVMVPAVRGRRVSQAALGLLFGWVGLDSWFANQNWSKGLCESETERVRKWK